MSDKTNEREALEEGLSSAFWTLFATHVTREWGPAGILYQQAVRDAAQSQHAVIDLQKVLYAQEQVHALMQWPIDRLKQLKAQAQPVEPTMSRRGIL